MKWRKMVEYRTSLTVDNMEFHVVAIKEGDEDGFAVEVNGEYIADCEELPTREFLEQIIREDAEIAERIGKSSYRLA